MGSSVATVNDVVVVMNSYGGYHERSGWLLGQLPVVVPGAVFSVARSSMEATLLIETTSRSGDSEQACSTRSAP